MRSLARWLRDVLRYGWFLVQIAIVLYGLAMFVYIVARITVGENWNLIAFANAFLPWLAWCGMGLALLALLSLPGLALFLAVAGPWFWAMQQRFDGFLHYFFVVQHFQRFSAGGFNNVRRVFAQMPADMLVALSLRRGRSPNSRRSIGWPAKRPLLRSLTRMTWRRPVSSSSTFWVCAH